MNIRFLKCCTKQQIYRKEIDYEPHSGDWKHLKRHYEIIRYRRRCSLADVDIGWAEARLIEETKAFQNRERKSEILQVLLGWHITERNLKDCWLDILSQPSQVKAMFRAFGDDRQRRSIGGQKLECKFEKCHNTKLVRFSPKSPNLKGGGLRSLLDNNAVVANL